MRLPNNNTCDLINGAGAASPGVIRSSGPCRLVLNTQAVAIQYPFDSAIRYATMDFDTPRSPVASGGGDLVVYDYSTADVVAFPSGGLPAWQVVYAERVLPFSAPSYYRAHLRPFGSSPPVSGCTGCALSPAQWVCSWMIFGWDSPFDAKAFVLSWVLGSAPACTWRYDLSASVYAILSFAAWPSVELAVTSRGVTWQYVATGAWVCNGLNEMVASSRPLWAPKSVRLAPLS